MDEPPDGKPNTLARWEIVSKFAIPLAVAFVGATFAWIQEVDSRRSTESRYFTDLMAQREKADSDLRQHMFDVLITNYFGAPVAGANAADDKDKPATAGAEPTTGTDAASGELDRMHRQIIFASLLSRNFDNIDTRPLFEELDRKLTAHIWPAGATAPKADAGAAAPNADAAWTAQRQRAFALREDLRRLAIGVSSRQVSALSSLKREGDDQQGRMRVFKPLLCRGDASVTLDGRFLLTSWKDGEVTMRALPALTPSLRPSAEYWPTGRRERRASAAMGPVSASDDIQLKVTFYDMPLLENLRFSDGKRGAFTLRSYVSHAACSTFGGQMDESVRAECSPLRFEAETTGRICDYAIIVLTEIPDWYIAPRDRPYVTDLLAGRFSNGERR